MSTYLIRSTAVILIGMFVGFFGTSCKKKAVADPQSMDEVLKLPGATNVMAALEQKDYDAAMAGLLKIKRSAASEQESLQYSVLSWEVKNRLMKDSTTDPKAAEALQTLRMMTTGR